MVSESTEYGKRILFCSGTTCSDKLARTAEQWSSGVGNILSYTGEQRWVFVVDDRWKTQAVIVNLLELLGFILMEAQNSFRSPAKSTYEYRCRG